MGRTRRKKAPAWPDVREAFAGLDQPALLALIADLYQFSKSNRYFLYARFAIGADVLEPYKKTIKESVYSDMLNEDVSADGIGTFGRATAV